MGKQEKITILKKLRFRVPVYGGEVIFVMTTNYKYVYELYDLEDYSQEDESCPALVVDHRTKQGRQKIYCIFNLKQLPKDTYSIMDFVGHELRHVVNNVALFRGLSNNLNEDEPLAYLQGVVLREMYKFIEEFIK